MLKKRLWLLSILISFSISAQIKGIVKDSLTGKPIPFANLWIENENISSSSEENGEFSIHPSEKSKKIIFSAVGFEKKLVPIQSAKEVTLKPIAYNLDEVVIVKKYETKVVEVGKNKTSISQAFENGPRIDIKFFPYFTKYKKTKFIKQVTIETDSRIENATLKIHFYSVDDNGLPGAELLTKDFIIAVKKGVLKTICNVSDFNLRMPKKGLFVGFEKIIIEKNKIETQVTDFNNNKTTVKKTYYPFVLYNFVERAFSFTFSGGKWIKETKQNTDGSNATLTVNEPAINLILTN